jgi:hypothetical protein
LYSWSKENAYPEYVVPISRATTKVWSMVIIYKYKQIKLIFVLVYCVWVMEGCRKWCKSRYIGIIINWLSPLNT